MSSEPSGPKEGSVCPTVAWGGNCEPPCRSCREREYRTKQPPSVLEGIAAIKKREEDENWLPERTRPIPIVTFRDVLELAACWVFIWPTARYGPPFSGFFMAGIFSFLVLLFLFAMVAGLFRSFLGKAGDSYLRRMMNGDLERRA